MKNCAFVLLLILAGGGLILSTGGCGSGGTTATGGAVTPPPTNADFIGGYFWQVWSGNVAGPTNLSQWGIVTADGAGMINAGLVAQNQAGVITGPFASPPLPYNVTPGGHIEISLGGGTLAGGISENGDLLAVSQVAPGFNPAIAILPRGEGMFNNASLSGDYHICSYFWNVANELSWWGGSVSFDGAGNATDWSAGLNNGGAINPPVAPIAFGNYAVGPAGLVTWFAPGVSLSGGIGLGGELVVLSGTTIANDLQMLCILIKKGAGLSNATFSGEYHTVALTTRNLPPPRYRSITTTTSADGAGNWEFLAGGTSNEDGVITPIGPIAPTPYTVAADGALDMPGPDYIGAVSASGRCAMLSGPYTPGGPLLFFMFR